MRRAGQDRALEIPSIKSNRPESNRINAQAKIPTGRATTFNHSPGASTSPRTRCVVF